MVFNINVMYLQVLYMKKKKLPSSRGVEIQAKIKLEFFSFIQSFQDHLHKEKYQTRPLRENHCLSLADLDCLKV